MWASPSAGTLARLSFPETKFWLLAGWDAYRMAGCPILISFWVSISFWSLSLLGFA
jgi:hypothetical protein